MKQAALFLALLVQLSFSAQDNPTQKAIERLNKHPEMKAASLSFLAVDCQSKTTIASLDEHRCMTPASATKLWSTATALKILGAKYRAKTQVTYSGKIDSIGVLHGHVAIRGFGDGSLGSAHFAGEQEIEKFFSTAIAKLQKLGIKSIEGFLVADGSSFGYRGTPEGWSWSDMGNYYGAFPTGIMLADNIVSLFFKTSNKGELSKIVDIQPKLPWMIWENYVEADHISFDNAYVFAAPYADNAYVSGTLPVNQSSFKVRAAIQDPERYAADLFRAKLQDSGISVQGNALGYRTLMFETEPTLMPKLHESLVYQHEGVELQEFIKIINHKSNNLFAETLIHWLAIHQGKLGIHNNGMAVLQEFWKSKLDLQTARITDGSGLSRTNRISARHFVDLLIYMQDDEVFLASLPTAGVSGTVKSLCQGQACSGKVIAKSGTINGVKSYAGYVLQRNGKKTAFAILVNDFQGSSTTLKNLMEEVLNTLIV